MASKKVMYGIRVFLLAVIFIASYLAGAYLPILQTARCQIIDNTLIVERTNPHNTSVVAKVIEIDSKGNVTEDYMRVNIEEAEEKLVYDQDDFKEFLETENNVFVTELSERTVDLISYFDVPATVLMVAVAISMLGSFVMLFVNIRKIL